MGHVEKLDQPEHREKEASLDYQGRQDHRDHQALLARQAPVEKLVPVERQEYLEHRVCP